MNNKVHTFVVDDQDHPQMTEIHAELKRLSGLVHNVGYVPYSRFVLHDVEEEERCFICVTIVRNWLLHLCSSTQLLVLHSVQNSISLTSCLDFQE
jgi:short-subunit dehydrogenase